MYSSSVFYADPTPPPPPARPISSYDPYGDRYSSPHPSHAGSPSPQPVAPTSRPMSLAGYPQSPPNHRHSYAPPPQSYAQPASPPAVSIHDYSRPAHSTTWPQPQQPQHRRRSSGYDQVGASSLDDSFGRLSMPPPAQTLASPYPSRGPSRSHSPAPATPPMTYPIPTADRLLSSEHSLDGMADNDKLHWAQDVLRVLERHLHPEGPSIDFADPSPTDNDDLPLITLELEDLLNTAIPIIISFTTHRNTSIAAMASYLKATLLASGNADDFLPRDPRQAFKDFESAARGGEARGWYRLGRDYENVGDMRRASDCYERGRVRGDVECLYRLGMANLLGQLGLPPSPQVALSLLAHAAGAATPDCPQPAFVYGMLLAGEFEGASVPTSLLLPASSASPALERQHDQARQHIEKAAYLCFQPAQYKLGCLYEHATLGCSYDPLMSVQWYSLASQAGDFEADMGLSKWFLCGAEGCFAKNEELARTFAAKAANAGLGTGCFALGYYYEVGIGGRKDTNEARMWYDKAARVGNPDAISRLAALSQPAPQALSLQDHQININNTLVRKRTQAQIRSDHYPGGRPTRRQQQIDTLRIEAEREARRAAANYGPPPQPAQNIHPQYTQSPAPQQPLYARRPSASMYPGPPPQVMAQPTPSPAPPPMHSPRMSQAMPPSLAPSSPPSSYPQPSAPAVAAAAQPSPTNKPQKKPSGKTGPQTFAEMGFVSKPVQDDGCCIM